jgi:hypothetical protein
MLERQGLSAAEFGNSIISELVAVGLLYLELFGGKVIVR